MSSSKKYKLLFAIILVAICISSCFNKTGNTIFETPEEAVLARYKDINIVAKKSVDNKVFIFFSDKNTLYLAKTEKRGEGWCWGYVSSGTSSNLDKSKRDILIATSYDTNDNYFAIYGVVNNPNIVRVKVNFPDRNIIDQVENGGFLLTRDYKNFSGQQIQFFGLDKNDQVIFSSTI